MKHLMSFVQYSGNFDEYIDRADFLQSLEDLGMNGVELVPCDGDPHGILPPEKVVGVHLPIFTAWMDFYRGDKARMAAEFGGPEDWEHFYGGRVFSDVMTQLETALDKAQAMGAQYVVFHVSEVTMTDVFTGRAHYTDLEIIDASIDVINQLLEGKSYDFAFLMENLWWAGLNFQNPEMAQRLLDGIHYHKTGFLLDTGHLMCCNPHLKTQEEGCKYIESIFEAQTPAVQKAIQAIHLHQSLSGETALAMHRNPLQLEGTVLDKFAQTYEYLNQIDTHAPWDCPKIAETVEKIAPTWLTHELAYAPRAEKEPRLAQQRKLFV